MTDQPEALRVAADLELYPASYTRDMQTARLLREQHAEIEELREFHQDVYDEKMDMLEAENEALRRDAERYRHLRNRDPAEVMSKEGKAAGVWIDCEDDLSGLQLLTGDDADAAIDAAAAIRARIKT